MAFYVFFEEYHTDQSRHSDFLLSVLLVRGDTQSQNLLGPGNHDPKKAIPVPVLPIELHVLPYNLKNLCLRGFVTIPLWFWSAFLIAIILACQSCISVVTLLW